MGLRQLSIAEKWFPFVLLTQKSGSPCARHQLNEGFMKQTRDYLAHAHDILFVGSHGRVPQLTSALRTSRHLNLGLSDVELAVEVDGCSHAREEIVICGG